MSYDFFGKPILNSPYEYPARHWELDTHGQPTHRIIEKRRPSQHITPIPKPRKRKGRRGQSEAEQMALVLDEGRGLSTQEQQYDTTSNINAIRKFVDAWRALPDPKDWKVTPETARLLQHWRHYQFSGYRPFFAQIEAVETVIWLTEVAPNAGVKAKQLLNYLADASHEANPALMRLALKMATGDMADLEEVYNTERQLLYVACTRARDHLLVSGVSPASEFIDDLRM